MGAILVESLYEAVAVSGNQFAVQICKALDLALVKVTDEISQLGLVGESEPEEGIGEVPFKARNDVTGPKCAIFD